MEVNKIYCMDNLELMKQVPDNYIDLIYCDILYGTGKKFKDYEDLKPNGKIIEEFYVPRIQEMYRILKETGTIYLQMDYRISHWIRCIMDDIFGYESFRNEIIWCYSGGAVSKKDFARKHDNILRYAKSDNYTFNVQYKPYKETTLAIGGGRHSLSSGGEKLDLERGTPLTDWWDDIKIVTSYKSEWIDYSTQKPEELIERIIKVSSNPGDIVADFFCGSGTTLVKAKEIGRQYIGCDISERAIEISNERINNLNLLTNYVKN